MEVVECLSAQGIFLKPPGTGTSPEEFPLQSSSALLRLWGGGVTWISVLSAKMLRLKQQKAQKEADAAKAAEEVKEQVII